MENLAFDFGCNNTSVAKKNQYKDVEFMTAKEKEKAFKCFSRVLKHRDSNLIDKNLYNHLYLHCGFIAHYDIHGFRATYSGQNFREFVEHFDKNSENFSSFWWYNDPDYIDLNRDMVNLATALAPQIYAELDAKKRLSELEKARLLAAKYGFKVVAE